MLIQGIVVENVKLKEVLIGQKKLSISYLVFKMQFPELELKANTLPLYPVPAISGHPSHRYYKCHFLLNRYFVRKEFTLKMHKFLQNLSCNKLQ